MPARMCIHAPAASPRLKLDEEGVVRRCNASLGLERMPLATGVVREHAVADLHRIGASAEPRVLVLVVVVASEDALLVNSGILPLFHSIGLWYGIDLSGNGDANSFFWLASEVIFGRFAIGFCCLQRYSRC